MSSTIAEIEKELSNIEARSDYLDRDDLVKRRTFLETELERLNGIGTKIICSLFVVASMLVKMCVVWW